MDIITIDWETFYDKDYSLSKLTIEEYVRDARFEVIGVGVKLNGNKTVWLSGTFPQIKNYLKNNYEWANSVVLAHHTLFDGSIMSWLYDIHPKVWMDTLCIARAVHGVEVSGSLANLAELHGLLPKGTYASEQALGKHRLDFTTAELAEYGDYCVNDVDLCYNLFNIFITNGFPKPELKAIDMTLRMFTEPVLKLDIPKLEKHLRAQQITKDEILKDVGVARSVLMSNQRFADELLKHNVTAPIKTSLRTGLPTFAFAKSDPEFVALLNHPNKHVAALANARLAIKSTLEETRTKRFIDIGKRGVLPVPIKYYAAHTGRWGGFDKVNLQNLPSRGDNAKLLKSCITAPEGYTLVEADSAQIEARVLAWLAGQWDLVEAFRRGDDVYVQMAATIYRKKECDVTPAERFVGKMTILGCGFGLGATTFAAHLKIRGVIITEGEAQSIITAYRTKYSRIPALWKEAQNALLGMYRGLKYKIGEHDVVQVEPWNGNVIRLPSGLLLRYDGLTAAQNDSGLQMAYKTRNGMVNIYGGKLIENIVQALARCIVCTQMLLIQRKTSVVLTVHDSAVICVPNAKVTQARAFVTACMEWTPEWAKGLPVKGEANVGLNYAESGEEDGWQMEE